MRPVTLPIPLLPVALVLEVTLLVVAGVAVGPLPVLAWTVGSMFLGFHLLRTAGAGVEGALSALHGQPGFAPHGIAPEAALDAALKGAAGALLFVPGLLSDAAGLLLAIPFVRRAVASRLGPARARPSANAERAPRGRPERARRARGATVDVDVIRPEDAPPSPFVHPRRIINVEPAARR